MNTNFDYLSSRYLTAYLVNQRNLSDNTRASYRATFWQFEDFLEEQGIPRGKLNFSHITREKVEEFLNWVETTRTCGISTRNQRLSALKAFFKYVRTICPDHLYLCNQVIDDIHIKKAPKPIVKYLCKEAITALLAQPDLNDEYGRRDLALLSLLYDAGIRVQELCDTQFQDLRLDKHPTITVVGKGRKARVTPLSSQNAEILRTYVAEKSAVHGVDSTAHLFTNHSGQKLTRGGVRYIIQKYVNKANELNPDANIPMVSPHGIRHTKAMHLLESGGNLIYIRDFLGHEDVETTQVYAKANPEVKRAAIEQLYVPPDMPQMPDWRDDPKLMRKLNNMGK
jgi:site-specific recombinase XerD